MNRIGTRMGVVAAATVMAAGLGTGVAAADPADQADAATAYAETTSLAQALPRCGDDARTRVGASFAGGVVGGLAGGPGGALVGVVAGRAIGGLLTGGPCAPG